MITILKLAGVSAVLSAGLVTAYEPPVATPAGSAKIFHERIAPEAPATMRVADVSGAVIPASVSASATDCSVQAWPYKSRDCMLGADGKKPVRTITIERRDAPNTSTLVRLPAEPTAKR